MTVKIFSQRLSRRRKELGIGQSELAKAAGLTCAALSNYESGKREPKIHVLAVLAEKLSCSADWLLGLGCGPPPPAGKVPAWVLPLVPGLEAVSSRTGRKLVGLVVKNAAQLGVNGQL